MLNQNLKYKIISQLGTDRPSPLQVITLEIWMIRGELNPISKEKVLCSLVLIICCLNIVI